MYLYKKTFYKFVKYAVVLGIVAGVEYFVGNFSALANITLGAALLAFANYLKMAVGLKLP